MKLYAPKYYKDFVCIADKCAHSCCIGWEIDIDSQTLDKYNKNTYGYGETIINSIDNTETPHFKLSENERCPHLNGIGLCNIILELGEDYLCDICREHPRFYNDTPLGKEVGLGMVCEEACRLILNTEDYHEMIEVGENKNYTAIDTAYNTLPHREKIYTILSAVSVSYQKKLHTIYNKYDVSPACISDWAWKDIIYSLEYLDEAHKELFSNYSSAIKTPKNAEKYLERALAYFIYRHCTEAIDEDDFRTSLGFCLFCEKLLSSIIRAKNLNNMNDIAEVARIISEELEYSEDNTEAIKLEFFNNI